jgi:hypothetical protein
MGWACGTYVKEERYIEDLVGKPQGKRLLGRRTHRWADNIKMDLKEMV